MEWRHAFRYIGVNAFGGRHYPTHITTEDKLRKGSSTEMFVTEIAFSVDIPPMTFSKRNLERKIGSSIGGAG